MTKAKHKPEPYIIKPCPAGGWRRYIMKHPDAHHLYALAETDAEHAPLFAAAPEMLDSLDPEMIESIADEIDCFEHSARAGSLRALAKRQRTVIAKATGQAA